jgi:hypothetical protein
VDASPPEAGAGYTVSAEQLAAAARKIHDAAEDSRRAVRDIKSTTVSSPDFGTRHTRWFADYAKGIEKLGAGAEAMCATLTAFAGQLGAAGRGYAAKEAKNAAALRRTGPR